MRDGSLLCRGKGNPEWNFTAPHGAGRLMKRSEAKASISLEEYKEAMKGIYSTSVSESTIDESPMAYRSIDDILDAVEPTVEITDIITPVYNFKASKAEFDEETADGED
jgi:RNA-splicing ligase RtcB